MMIPVIQALQATNYGGKLGELCVPVIAFADDVGLTSTTKKRLEELINIVIHFGATFNMKVSGKKSKVMRLSNDETAYIVLEPMMLEYK